MTFGSSKLPFYQWLESSILCIWIVGIFLKAISYPDDFLRKAWLEGLPFQAKNPPCPIFCLGTRQDHPAKCKLDSIVALIWLATAA